MFAHLKSNLLIKLFVRSENTPRSEQPSLPPSRPRDGMPTGGTSGEYYVETYIFVNPELVKSRNLNIKDHLQNMMSLANEAYHLPTINKKINMALVGFEEIPEPKAGLDTAPKPNCTPYLNAFADFQHRIFKERGVPEPDVAVYMTNKIFCMNGQCLTAACAYLDNMCGKRSSIVLGDLDDEPYVQFSHELGHLLGMRHNEDDSCKVYGPVSLDDYPIMSTVKMDGRNVNKLTWSRCNNAQHDTFWQSFNPACISNRPTVNMLDNYQRRRSRRSPLSLNGQCKLIYGRGWKYCKEISNCSAIYCSPTANHEDCITNGNGLADGTECGVNKVCLNGSCTENQFKKLPKMNTRCGVV